MTSGHILAIKQLPAAATTLLPGRVYLLLHGESAPVMPLAWATLLAAAQRTSAIWISSSDVDRELDAPDAERMKQAVRAGKIRVLLRKAGMKSAQVLLDMEFWGAEAGTLFVLDHAESLLFSVQDLANFREFAQKKDCTFLLLAGDEGKIPEGADLLAGVARMARKDTAILWKAHHWHGEGGAVAAQSFELALNNDGTFSGLRESSTIERRETFGDENQIYVTRAALSGKSAPESWIVADDFEALAAATARATAATIILHFSQYAKFEELTRLVFDLRASCGDAAKILVREVNLHLRYSQEQLLLKLGANMVIPAEVLFSRIVSFVGMVQGQIYPHIPESDFDAALARVMPERKQGYLPAGVFVETVKAVLERVNALAIQNALIRLPLTPGITPNIAIGSCWMNRPGDFCTADTDSVYVFLFACRESDIDLSLDRQFSFPLPDLFGLQVRHLSHDSIMDALTELEKRAGDCPEIDLDGAPERPEAQKALMSASPEEIIHRTPPVPAVRRPLPLKGAMA